VTRCSDWIVNASEKPATTINAAARAD